MSDKSNCGAGFWLPSEFLSDKEDDKLDSNSDFCFPTEFPYDFASFGSSSLTESEGDEDDLVTGLTRQFTRSASLDTNKLRNASLGNSTEKKCVFSGSPQSTLSPVFSNGSPNGGPSSPTGPVGSNDLSWDLICAAAGQVNMWKINNEGALNNKALLTGASNFTAFQCPNSAAARLFNENDFKQERGSIWSQPQVYQNRGAPISAGNSYGLAGVGRCGRAQCLPEAAWPSLQYQKQQLRSNSHGLGAKPVFSGCRRYISGESSVKTKSAGTGVFLPRRYPAPTDSRDNKSGFSSGHNPAMATKVLNASYDTINNQAQYIGGGGGGGVVNNGGLLSNGDAARMMMMMRSRNAAIAQQQWNNNMMKKKLVNMELGLPNEWSY